MLDDVMGNQSAKAELRNPTRQKLQLPFQKRIARNKKEIEEEIVGEKRLERHSTNCMYCIILI